MTAAAAPDMGEVNSDARLWGGGARQRAGARSYHEYTDAKLIRELIENLSDREKLGQSTTPNVEGVPLIWY